MNCQRSEASDGKDGVELLGKRNIYLAVEEIVSHLIEHEASC